MSLRVWFESLLLRRQPLLTRSMSVVLSPLEEGDALCRAAAAAAPPTPPQPPTAPVGRPRPHRKMDGGGGEAIESTFSQVRHRDNDV